MHHYTHTLLFIISVILFASCNLPGLALLHLKQFGIFSMMKITHLTPRNPLVIRARNSILAGMKTWRSRHMPALWYAPLLKNLLPKETFKKTLSSLL